MINPKGSVARIGILAFGYTEIIIGLVTIISLAEAGLLGGMAKPAGVFLFVLATSVVSSVLGLGILKRKMWARRLLLFFAGYIVLTKIFIFLGILNLSHPFETLIPSFAKNIISCAYHLSAILFFSRENVRGNFI